ncbi:MULTISPECIES: ubiquinol-cytochrome c reductase iron-sulfur subunit [unclassified Ectothiorhodospira]|uniref:ubiquinol-cytochrome c reductase iron-sulfur subunit n=1 Tax=unclassified Ectothiorhodospira TaxID=2684909 RepID=UPI001EE978C4|nr:MULTISPECIES: ubiquinol-cytochrome c reductase iron-sulfur subunit [unclassified Ectothiorhodospira]MCG5515097.1 ubiquinol-cytochrome c reductase iron-sulfur subunit [Ectothiorhodospira sp. 9100]MCG5517814.1 ubiquinol-cytochrome c reductase iron-sulfur subunit [Ectothiorhodospira sp. 9905]
MSYEDVNQNRRRFLVAATSVVGGAGVVGLAYPYLSTWAPSARAQAAGAPVEFDVSQVEPGQLIVVEWRGKPVWVTHRTPEMLDMLPENRPRLVDPDSKVETQQPAYAQNETRSRKPEYSVLIGICTHLGCSPSYRPEIAPSDLGQDWKGGYFCACHGSRFDLAGRVWRNVPAPTNLVVPVHMYVSDTLLVVGEDEEGVAL